MSTRIFGWRRSGTSTTTADVIVTDYDDGWGIDSISTPVAFQKTWCGDDITIFGENNNITPANTWVDCSCFNGNNTYMNGTLASGMTVSSNSIGDHLVSGGVHAVTLEYLDTNWAQQSATVALNGKIPVYIANVFRPQRMYAVKVGKSGAAIGDISLCYSGNKYLKIKAGRNVSHNGYYYVAGNKELMITDSFCTPTYGCKTAMEFRLYKQEPKTYLGTTYYPETYSPMGTTVADYTVMNLPLPVVMPYSVKEKCRVRVRVITTTGSGQAYIRGYLVNKKS